MPPDALPVRRPDPVDGRASEASGVQARPPGRARASDGAGRLWCAGAVPHRCPVSVRAVSGGSAAPPAIQAQPVWIRLRRPTGLPDPCRAARGGSAWLPGAAGGAVIRHHPAVARRPDRQLLRGGSSSSVLLLRGCSAGSSARQLGQEGGGAWPSALHGILAVLAAAAPWAARRSVSCSRTSLLPCPRGSGLHLTYAGAWRPRGVGGGRRRQHGRSSAGFLLGVLGELPERRTWTVV